MSWHNIGWIFRHYARNVCMPMAGGVGECVVRVWLVIGGGTCMFGYVSVPAWQRKIHPLDG